MQVDSLISNPLSQDILQKGHLSIRFAKDGFSLLVSDAGYRPVQLKRYTFEDSVPTALHPEACGRTLDRDGLLAFEGETVLILDAPALILVPEQLFLEQRAVDMLEKACEINDTDLVQYRYLKERRLNLIFAVPQEIMELKGRFSGSTVILSPAECLISLADQIKASDHQRGFVMVDVQPFEMDILFIRRDRIELLNRYALKEPSQFIYYTLNTIRQLELDRENLPVYLSGMVHQEHELFGLLAKYVRRVKITPYYLEGISREEMLAHMILSEASKCA